MTEHSNHYNDSQKLQNFNIIPLINHFPTHSLVEWEWNKTMQPLSATNVIFANTKQQKYALNTVIAFFVPLLSDSFYCHTIHSDTSYYRSTTDQNYLETSISNAWDCCNIHIYIYILLSLKQTNRKLINHKYNCFIIPNTKKHYIFIILYLHSHWLSPVS